MRTTAKLMDEGFADDKIIERIGEDNLVQFPTEKSIRSLVRVCLCQLHALDASSLVRAIANQSSDVTKQIYLYSKMKRNRFVWEFYVYSYWRKVPFNMNTSFCRMDVNTFFMRQQEQDDGVASWSESTVKNKSVLVSILVENRYLDSNKSTALSPVLICCDFENAIRSNNADVTLSAFNCFMQGGAI